jgi:5-methylcytosine-specific restriction endonuclease McrA
MPRDYKKEYANYHGKKKQIENRSKRNSARSEMEKKGAVSKGDGKDVDHKVPIAKGGSNDSSNLRVTTKAKNRSFARTKSARMK